MTDELTIFIDEDGGVQHIYDDAAAELFAADGAVDVRRASHVEPHPRGGWYVDMRPVDGPVMGADGAVVGDLDDSMPVVVAAVEPFTTRAAALAAEREWLEAWMAEGRLEAS